MGASTRFDNAHFLSLKQRVHSLKTEQQRLIKSEQAVKQVRYAFPSLVGRTAMMKATLDMNAMQAESAAVLELRQQHHAELQELEEQAATLQHQLKQNTERSAKLRAQYERCVSSSTGIPAAALACFAVAMLGTVPTVVSCATQMLCWCVPGLQGEEGVAGSAGQGKQDPGRHRRRACSQGQTWTGVMPSPVTRNRTDIAPRLWGAVFLK